MRFGGKCLDAGIAASAGGVLGAGAIIAGITGAMIRFPGEALPLLAGPGTGIAGAGCGAIVIAALGVLSWLAVGQRVAGRCHDRQVRNRQVRNREGAHSAGVLGGRLVHILEAMLLAGGILASVWGRPPGRGPRRERRQHGRHRGIPPGIRRRRGGNPGAPGAGGLVAEVRAGRIDDRETTGRRPDENHR